MGDVKRYAISSWGMVSMPTGDYVRCSDYAALQARVAELEAERDEADDLAKAAFADGASNNIRLAEAAHRIKELEAENHLLKTAGIVEVAVRNPSVMEYMKHWEGRVAELEAERDGLEGARIVNRTAIRLLQARAEAAEALLSEAVKAGMMEGAKAADCGCLPDKSDCLAVKNSVPICYRDGAAEIHALSSDPATIARIVAQLKEGRG